MFSKKLTRMLKAYKKGKLSHEEKEKLKDKLESEYTLLYSSLNVKAINEGMGKEGHKYRDDDVLMSLESEEFDEFYEAYRILKMLKTNSQLQM